MDKGWSKILVVQSQPLPFSWLNPCIESVVSWCLVHDYDRVLWLDADLLIFSPEQFQLPPLWKLSEGFDKLKAHIKVDNAFLLFDRGNSFLDFYIDQATRFLHQCDERVPPQFIGQSF